MTNFQILGEVIARQGDWEADLQPQQKLLLAALVIAEGALVSSSELEHVLGWDVKDNPPEKKRVRQVASELRGKLRPALPDAGPLLGGDRAYRLLLQPEQADVLRFSAGFAAAKRESGADRGRLMRAALAEWGPRSVGLYGGYTLSGLSGEWAEGTRIRLRREHRNAVLECIRQDMRDRQYEKVMMECDQRSADGCALGEEEFVKNWVHATWLTGDRALAGRIFRDAADFAKSSLNQEPGGWLRGLAEMIRTEDPRLSNPDLLTDLARMAVPEVLGLPAVHTAPAPPRNLPARASSIPAQALTRPASSALASNERTAMSEPSITFNIAGTARVGSAIGRNEGSVTIHMGAADDPVTGPGVAEPGSAEEREEH